MTIMSFQDNNICYKENCVNIPCKIKSVLTEIQLMAFTNTNPLCAVALNSSLIVWDNRQLQHQFSAFINDDKKINTKQFANKIN